MTLEAGSENSTLIDASGSYMDVRTGTTVNILTQSLYLVGGISGSTAQSLRLDNLGNLFITGSTTVTNFPVTQSVKVDQSITLTVSVSNTPTITGSVGVTSITSPVTVIQGASGTLGSPWPVLLVSGGTAFGTPANALFVSDSFSNPPSGALPNKIAVIGGYDFNNNIIRPLRVDYNGFVMTKNEESEQTFMTNVTGVQIDLNKSMFSLFNSGTSSTVVLKIRKIFIVNAQISTILTTEANFELRKITSHSAGFTVVPQPFDSTDILNSVVGALTGSTVVGESTDLLRRVILRTDIIDPRQNPVWSFGGDNTKPLFLRGNEGFTIKQTVNSIDGIYDITVIFTQERF